MRTSATNVPFISVKVVAVVPPPIEVKPYRFVMLGPQQGTSPPMTATIRNHRDVPLKLSTPEVSIPGARVQLEETEPGQVFELKLVFPPELQLSSRGNDKVTIATSDAKYPKLEIPIVTRDLSGLRSRRGRTVGAPPRPPDVTSATGARRAQPAVNAVQGHEATVGSAAQGGGTFPPAGRAAEGTVN
jgi:hypothetical protein